MERNLIVQMPEDSSEVEVVGTQISKVQVIPEFPTALLAIAGELGLRFLLADMIVSSEDSFG